jgi:hypothetical protein
MNAVAPRRRVGRTIALAVVIGLGLLSRSALASHVPQFVETYAGDTLWALALFLGLSLLLPKVRAVVLAVLALALAGGIELSQLYQAPWINRLRGTDLGGLILGFGFKWTDLICYTGGIALGAAGECAGSLRRTEKTP